MKSTNKFKKQYMFKMYYMFKKTPHNIFSIRNILAFQFNPDIKEEHRDSLFKNIYHFEI